MALEFLIGGIKQMWNIEYWGIGNAFDSLKDAIAEVSEYITGEGRSLKSVEKECLEKGRSLGETWGIWRA